MSELFSVRVEGLSELAAKLHRIPFAVTDKVMRPGVLDGARVFAKAARRNAAGLTKTPRRSKNRAPGTIAKSVVAIRDRKLSGPYTPTAMAWVAAGKKYRKRGKDAYYWPWVELGHKIVPRAAKKLTGARARISISMRRRSWNGKRVRPYPTLGPTARTEAQAAVERVRASALARIDRVMRSA